jgi:hypothetical protein
VTATSKAPTHLCNVFFFGKQGKISKKSIPKKKTNSFSLSLKKEALFFVSALTSKEDER